MLFQGPLTGRLQQRASLHSFCKSSGVGDRLSDQCQRSILSPRVVPLLLWESEPAVEAEVVGKGSAVRPTGIASLLHCHSFK